MTRPVLALITAAGCGAAMHGPREDPAYLARSTPESQAAIQHAVDEAFGGIHMAVDEDALTRDGALVIDRVGPQDPRQMLSEGRDPSAPGFAERFHLAKIGERCVLIHDRTDRQYDLPVGACMPL